MTVRYAVSCKRERIWPSGGFLAFARLDLENGE